MPQDDPDARGTEQGEAGAQHVDRRSRIERVGRQAQAPSQLFVDRIGEGHDWLWTRTVCNAATCGAPNTTCARAVRTFANAAATVAERPVASNHAAMAQALRE